MSLKAYFEFFISLQEFKCFDLYNQGLYMQRIQIFEEKEGGVINYAQPMSFEDSSNPEQSQNIFYPSEIKDEEYYYQTKAFLVKFQQERVQLDESVRFRLECEAYPHLRSLKLFLVSTLYFADLTKIGGQGGGGEDFFQKACSFKVQLSKQWRSIHEFLPILFSEDHFCLTQSTLHCHLVDLRFQLSSSQLQMMQSQSIKSVLLTPNNFTEYLNQTLFKYGKTTLDIFYEQYVQSMEEQYYHLVEFYSQLQKLKASSTSTSSTQPNQLSLLALPGDKISGLLKDKSYFNKEQIATTIESRVHEIGDLAMELWQHVTCQINSNRGRVTSLLQDKYTPVMSDKWGQYVFRNVVQTNDFSQGLSLKEEHKNIAKQIRKAPMGQLESPLSLLDLNMYPAQSGHPVIFEEVYKMSEKNQFAQMFRPVLKQQSPLPCVAQGNHLLVLVHGFQGSSYDMRSLRNNICLMLTRKGLSMNNYTFLCSSANEDSTEGNIQDMGHNLAQEVKHRIAELGSVARISFIGHSLGGLIIRAALGDLIEVRQKMFTYMSLSSPHLGYMQNKSQLVEAGLWLLKKVKKCEVLQQLTMEDSKNIPDTYLYRLSCAQGLDWFPNIAFLSSFQDMYVPFHSARMQNVPSTNNSTNQMRYQEMVHNIMCKINNEMLHRIDIDFEKSDNKVIDNIIGRHAHIQFIEDQTMMRMIAHTFEKLFI